MAALKRIELLARSSHDFIPPFIDSKPEKILCFAVCFSRGSLLDLKHVIFDTRHFGLSIMFGGWEAKKSGGQ